MIEVRLSAILGDRLLKISQVAHDIGVSRTTLTNLYYRRTKQISFDVLEKLCIYLNCGIEDILQIRSEGR